MAGLRGLDYLGVTVPLLDVHRSSWDVPTHRDGSSSGSSSSSNSSSSGSSSSSGTESSISPARSARGSGGPSDERSRMAGMLPVGRVAAASSAFLGGACVAGWAASEALALADQLELVSGSR